MPHRVNERDNFIGGWYTERLDICSSLIGLFWDSSEEHKAGLMSRGLDPAIKESTELSCDQQPKVIEYFNEILVPTVKLYLEKYPMCGYYSSWGLALPANLQYYKPGQAYHGWHTERFAASEPAGRRHLAWMTYLNTIHDEGETEFYHQGVKVKPEIGLTLIWGVDWTFTHRGVPSPTAHKYIITGWFNFID